MEHVCHFIFSLDEKNYMNRSTFFGHKSINIEIHKWLSQFFSSTNFYGESQFEVDDLKKKTLEN